MKAIVSFLRTKNTAQGSDGCQADRSYALIKPIVLISHLTGAPFKYFSPRKASFKTAWPRKHLLMRRIKIPLKKKSLINNS